MISAETGLRNFEWYLGGPMTGYPEFNFPAFDFAEWVLREKWGLDVLSAHKIDHGEHTGAGTQPWKEYLRGDLRQLLVRNGLILLQGWPESKGASREFSIAQDLEYPILQFWAPNTDNAYLIPLSRQERFDVTELSAEAARASNGLGPAEEAGV